MNVPHGYPSSQLKDHSGYEDKDFKKQISNKNRKRALVVGINYSGSYEIEGCVEDALLITHLLKTKLEFPKDDILLLTDAAMNGSDVKTGSPTYNLIVESIEWLMCDAKEGDSLFFYFSGHGKKLIDLDGDEADGYDDALCPLDFSENMYITDDFLYEHLVQEVPIGAMLTCIIDARLSGTILDLPYMHDIETWEIIDSRKNMNASKFVEWSRKWGPIPKYEPRKDSEGGHVVCLTTEAIERTYEYSSNHMPDIRCSPFTYCVVQVLEKEIESSKRPSYREILLKIEDKLRYWKKSSEKPQKIFFSSAHRFNVESEFEL